MVYVNKASVQFPEPGNNGFSNKLSAVPLYSFLELNLFYAIVKKV